jgi:hypothetical protein
MLRVETQDAQTLARQRLRQLAGAKAGAGGLEGGLEGGADLSRGRLGASVELLREALAKRVVENPATPMGQSEADRAVVIAEGALQKLAGEGPEAQLSPAENIMLEAVIEIDGSRPSVPVQDGFVDLANPILADWAGELAMARQAVERAIASTGRLIRGGDTSETSVFGTAWVIAPGLIATAQHVLEALYVPHGGGWAERFGPTIEIDFHVEADRPARPADRIRVIGVERASPDRIGNALNLANLDAAILRLDPNGPAAPPPLTLASQIQGAGPKTHVVGHPFRPATVADATQPADDPRRLTEGILALVFGDIFGVKRWSPGEFLSNPGSLAGDIHGRVMLHDCSTLGGNSGSPVFDFSRFPDRVAGLHYAGEFRSANYMHPVEMIRDHLALPGVQFA